MAKVDWRYNRPGSTTCGKTQGFLAKKKIDTVELVTRRKRGSGAGRTPWRSSRARTSSTPRGARRSSGSTCGRGRPDKATIERLLLGPTGNLRAPTLRVGRTLLVGFDEETYRKVLGSIPEAAASAAERSAITFAGGAAGGTEQAVEST